VRCGRREGQGGDDEDERDADAHMSFIGHDARSVK
jgi:hypothetical protein